MCTNVADRTINANKPLGTLLMVSTYRVLSKPLLELNENAKCDHAYEDQMQG